MGGALPEFRLWAMRAVLLCPPLLLSIVALPRFASGVALEAAFPVPSYMSTARALPLRAYRETARALAEADAADGESQIARGRAAYLSGEVGPQVIAMTDNGISHAPSLAAGWTLLAALRTPVDRARAAAAVSVALELAPHDYYLAVWRARVAAPLWPDLDVDTRENAARQVRAIWSDRSQRHGLRTILVAADGPTLVTYAMKDDPNGLRALNRMVARERLGLPDAD